MPRIASARIGRPVIDMLTVSDNELQELAAAVRAVL
jgi:hypothetical protein